MTRPARPRPIRISATRYYDADGNRVNGPSDGITSRSVQSETWYALVAGRRVSLRTTDEGEAWAELRRLLHQAERRRVGIIDDHTEAAERPLAAHVADWIAAVRAGHSGRLPAEQHLHNLKAHVERLAQLGGWRHIADIDASSCLAALGELMAGGKSAQTRNHYLRHTKQFTAWLHDDGRLERNPIRQLRQVPIDADRRHERRAPTAAEITTLLTWLETGPAESSRTAGRGGKPKGGAKRVRVRDGMDGPQRALGYRLAMATGLRASELRSLTRRSFDLDAATVSVQACYSKRRRRDVLPLPEWLVEALRGHFDAGRGCWGRLPHCHPGDALRRDLRDAGIPYVVEEDGRRLFFDFHSLRYWFCTKIANQSGISPKTMMALCRHSTPALTLTLYAQTQSADVRAAAERIPRPG